MGWNNVFGDVLYFVLGFLAAALLALMVSPAIWNRAVVLTRQRIESSVPLTLNEVQADKDQLRAEFAMSTRRLELSIEELQEKANRQVIDINRKRDELTKLADECREKVRMVEDLEAQSADLREKLSRREEQLQQTTQDLETTHVRLEERAKQLEELNRKAADAQMDADSRRIELVAKQTTLDDTNDQMRGLEEQIADLREKLATMEKSVERAEREKAQADERRQRAETLRAQLETRMQEAEQTISRARQAEADATDTSNEVTRLLTAERERSNKLEGQLAKATLRMEAVLTDASNENVSKAMTVVNQEKTALRKQIRDVTRERDALQKRLSDMNLRADASWEDERKENAVLRERLNDLAAKVAAMTATMEGPDSPILEIIDKATVGVNAKTADKAVETDAKAATGGTLADRIRALQDAARVKQASSG